MQKSCTLTRIENPSPKRTLIEAAANSGFEPFLFNAALCPNVGCLRVADFPLFSFSAVCREANVFLTESAPLQKAKRTGVNLKSFRKNPDLRAQ